MGSEVLGPGAAAPGPTYVAAAAARAWAIAAATAAVGVPASGAEAAAWTVRGWADVAVGCLALDGPVESPAESRAESPADSGAPGAFAGLDEVIRSVPGASGGQHAARLRRLRRFAGPVPPCYPDARPVDGPIRGVRPAAWLAADHLAGLGERLMMTATRLPWHAPCPLRSDRQLAWGARYRSSPSGAHLTLALPVDRWLARRTWMCLPGPSGNGSPCGPGARAAVAAVAEVPSTATPLAQQIWRGIHEGAHLDHLSVLARCGGGAPSPAEFGDGLLAAESYAMAVEILAAVECLLAGEGAAVWQLGAGLVERATRLPGGSDPAPEFTDLPTLAEVYVLGPLHVLAGGPPARTLPAEIIGALRARWRAACAAYPPAAAFTAAAAELLSGSPGRGSAFLAIEMSGLSSRDVPPLPATIFIKVNPV
jgi:hypothetical protein